MNSPLSHNSLTSVEVPSWVQADPTQMMLKCLSLAEPNRSDGTPALLASASNAVVEATQRVVQVMEGLRSPDSGWPADVPQTPENLVPYVAEEMYDVIGALQAVPHSAVQTDARWQRYVALQSLLPWLLWAIARSSYDVMCLIEGISAECIEENQSQTGILRLVARLDAAAANFDITLDLATQQLPPDLIPAASHVRSQSCSLCQEAIAADALLEHITQQVKLTTPLLVDFFDGIDTELLVPTQPWQTGLLWLQLGFEFVPTEEVSSDVSTMSPSPTLKLSETDWLEDYAKTVGQQQMQAAIAQLPEFQVAAGQTVEDSEMLVSKLVSDTHRLLEWLQNPVVQSSQTCLRRDLSLNTFSRWILWCLSRSTYEIMQLMGGVPATLLQPKFIWQHGTLRLLAALKLKTVERDWCIDVGTGQALPYALESASVPSDSLVQSQECAWCQHPNLIHHLHSEVITTLQQTTPELQLFMDGTDIDIAEGQDWEPGVVQLVVMLEFIPG